MDGFNCWAQRPVNSPPIDEVLTHGGEAVAKMMDLDVLEIAYVEGQGLSVPNTACCYLIRFPFSRTVP